MKYLEKNNSRSSFKRRKRNANPMLAYDVLPPELRRWLAHAALPWSAQSALRVWRKALKASNNDVGEAHLYLSRLEMRKLGSEANLIWGESYPVVHNDASGQGT